MGANSNKEELIFLTGIIRSGSTWTGRVLGNHKKLRYYHEPFQPTRNHKGNPFDEFFQYVSLKTKSKTSVVLSDYMKKLMSYSIPGLYDVGDKRNWKKIRLFYHPWSKIVSIINQQIPFIKDPCAIFISEWIANNYNTKMIVTIRHPAAFVNSSKKAGWHYGFQTFLSQPQLMEDYLSSFKEEMQADIARGEETYSLENATLFWRIMQSVLNEYYRKYSEWYFVRHEDLLINPIKEFEKLFDFLGLEMDTSTKKYLNQSIKVHKDSEKTRLKRNPKEVLTEWKRGLSKAEIEYIKNSSQTEWELFYSESDW